MTDVQDISMQINRASTAIRQAQKVPIHCTENMIYTANAIDELGTEHFGQGGENMPNRIIQAQAGAMFDLVFAYSEQAYEADVLSFDDDSQREKFDDLIDEAVDNAKQAADNGMKLGVEQ